LRGSEQQIFKQLALCLKQQKDFWRQTLAHIVNPNLATRFRDFRRWRLVWHENLNNKILLLA
jgi:hypothetical protein